jgi:hypothetical protein
LNWCPVISELHNSKTCGIYPWLTKDPTLQVSAIGSTANWRSEALQNDQLEVTSVLNFQAAQCLHVGGYARVLASARVMLQPAGLAIGG